MLTGTSPAYTWFFLAMAHKRLGHDDQAHEFLTKAIKRSDEELLPKANASWNRRLTLQLLRREAEGVLGVTPTAAPAGKDEKARGE